MTRNDYTLARTLPMAAAILWLLQSSPSAGMNLAELFGDSEDDQVFPDTTPASKSYEDDSEQPNISKERQDFDKSKSFVFNSYCKKVFKTISEK